MYLEKSRRRPSVSHRVTWRRLYVYVPRRRLGIVSYMVHVAGWLCAHPSVSRRVRRLGREVYLSLYIYTIVHVSTQLGVVTLYRAPTLTTVMPCLWHIFVVIGTPYFSSLPPFTAPEIYFP